MDQVCSQCEKPDKLARIEKCSICFKYFCRDHSYSRSGRRFCSKPCAEFFFFGDGEETGD